ncbi:hypothetical protein D3C72_1386620 [compost metagenome]
MHVDFIAVGVGADDPGQRAVVGRGQTDLLRHLVELFLEGGAQQRIDREIAVDLLVVVKGRIGGDGGQGHAIGEVLVDRQHAVEAVGVVEVGHAGRRGAGEGLGVARRDAAHWLAGQVLAGPFDLEAEGQGVAGQIVDDGATD